MVQNLPTSDSAVDRIVSSAPVRIDAGGPTDIPQLREDADTEGVVFNAAITPRATVTIQSRADPVVLLRSADYHRSETYANLGDLQSSGRLDLLKAAVLSIAPTRGFELTAKIGLPPGSGLGASAALAVATLSALHALQDESADFIDPEMMAQEAISLEVNHLGNTTGSQDQFAAATGGFNMFVYRGNTFERTRLEIREDIVQALEDRLVIIYSGVSRVSGHVLNGIVAAFRKGDPQIRDGLQRNASLARQMSEAITRGQIDHFGTLVAHMWEAHRSLAKEITTNEIEQIIQLAKQNGAIGAKVLGAGGGGCVLIVCAEGKKEQLGALFSEKYKVISFHFSEPGVRTLYRRG